MMMQYKDIINFELTTDGWFQNLPTTLYHRGSLNTFAHAKIPSMLPIHTPPRQSAFCVGTEHILSGHKKRSALLRTLTKDNSPYVDKFYYISKSFARRVEDACRHMYITLLH
ncbi:hypothetical protein HQ35_08105 [Porphyromonas cangingivalis]|uniref:Uncharacterized protein n=1 Tax=Porphyromonas cangingivalis TaxID=36874 RepID=A0A0A2ENJ1_PORCN|nr:hypothetical protein HQ35_08105 [Porphyromonas cangingivalis]